MESTHLSRIRELILVLFRVKSWPLWVRFSLLGVLFVVSVSIPAYLLVREMQQTIEFAEHEQAGLKPVQFQLAIIQKTQQHRGLASWYLNDPFASPKEVRAKGEDVEEAIVRFEQYGKHFRHSPVVDLLNKQTEEWHQLSQAVRPRAISAQESFTLHTNLIARQFYGLNQMLTEYQLILDPERHSYFLISSGMVELPKFLEFLGQLRAAGVAVLAKQEVSEADRQQLMALMYAARWQLREYHESIMQIVDVKQESNDPLIQQYKNLVEQSSKLLQMVNDDIVFAPKLALSPAEYYSRFTLGINTGFALAQLTGNQINEALMHRIEVQKANRIKLITVIVLVSVLMLGVSAIFVVRLLRWIGGEPDYAMKVVSDISNGYLSLPIHVKRPDSLLGEMRVMQQKLLEQDRLKSEFISTVSHELRTPMTAINGALALIQKQHHQHVNPDAIRLLEMASRNGERLKELINDLLDVEQLGSDAMDLRCDPCNVVQLVRDMEPSVRLLAQRYHVEINFNYLSESIVASINGQRFQQIVQNFISNALKFSSRGDSVDVFVSDQNGYARVEVTDHGCGIPLDFYSRIFTRFSQADSSDTRKVGGTGLGLAIAKSLAERMGGSVGFTSQEKVGSSFYVSVPVLVEPV